MTRPVFVLRLRARPGADPVHVLRAILKVLWRHYGLQCVGLSRECDT